MMVSQRASQDCFCQKYLNLLAENTKLQEEVARLKAKLARQERTAKELPFGLSTPSSKRLVKPSLPELTEEEKEASCARTCSLLPALSEASASANSWRTAQDTTV